MLQKRVPMNIVAAAMDEDLTEVRKRTLLDQGIQVEVVRPVAITEFKKKKKLEINGITS